MEKAPSIKMEKIIDRHTGLPFWLGPDIEHFGKRHDLDGVYSLLPGDWHYGDGVAFQADPCEKCGGGGLVTDPACLERWPECIGGGYDPRCCRFPKSCSADKRCSSCHGLRVVPRHGSIELRCDRCGRIGSGHDLYCPSGSDATLQPVLVVPLDTEKGGA